MRLPDFLEWNEGEIWLTGHRISLLHLIGFYQEGFSAEMLREQFPTLSMATIHKVLGFYWEHRVEVEAVLDAAHARSVAARAAGEHLDVDALRTRLAAGATIASPD